MSYVHTIIKDGDTEALIRKYLKADVMVNGLSKKTEIGSRKAEVLVRYLVTSY